MPGKTKQEAAENFVHFLKETLSCVAGVWLTAFQESEKLYKVTLNPPVELKTNDGSQLFIIVTQVFVVNPIQDQTHQFKVSTREYSYRLVDQQNVNANDIVSYHWHPHDSDLRDPHLHIGQIPRIHFPTSRVCLEDFVLMLIKYYEVKPRKRHSEYKSILNKNKSAFEKMATWKIKHPS